MAQISGYFKTAYSQLDAHAALGSPPSNLLGVPDGSNGTSPAALLQALNINTVFDLALSSAFADATTVLGAAENPLDPIAQYGSLPSGILSSKAAGIAIGSLGSQPVDVLKQVDDAGIAAAFGAVLGIDTVRDMALWPPYLEAKRIMNLVLNPALQLKSDSEAPSDLIPISGEYPTERVYYSTLLFDSLSATDSGTPLKDLIAAGPIDPAGAIDLTFGFSVPAEGAMLVYQQSWYAQGVALGQLLHSVALAPGEATKIAMVDWFRRTTGTRTETGSESEQLVNDTTHARSISEVTSAVATEAQSGFSQTTTNSSSGQGGLSFGGFDIGLSLGGASSSGSATSVSSSSGRRELDASMNQNIMDSTHQAANAVRNRRATVVQEVTEAETVTATTRVVANYNHMHALSVQYYEVVQVYRAELILRRVDRLLYVPLKMVDFSQVTLNPQQQAAISQAATSPSVAQAYSVAPVAGLVHLHTAPPVVNVPAQGAPPASPTGSSQATPTATASWNQSSSPGPLRAMPNTWAEQQAATLQPSVGSQVQPVDSQTLSLPRDLNISSITVVGSHDGDVIVIAAPDGTVTQCPIASSIAQLAQPVSVANVQTISLVTKTNLDAGAVAMFQLQMPAGATSLISAPLPSGGPAEQTIVIVQITDPAAGANMALAQQELQLNRLYYNQVLWRNLDAATIALLLSPYQYKGRPILEQIDPTPVAIVANYIVFRMPVTPDFSYANASAGSLTDAQAWGKWLDDHGLSRPTPTDQIVPLPSGGVFAEAVLGRFNSAEKLDLTRFWNWQDSPIPLAPSDIAPVSTDTRDNPPSLQPGAFGQPLVNIVSPTSLPDPTGLAAALSAIQNGNMFRDMSGLAATIGLLQSTVQGTTQAAGQAAQQAGQNMANTQQFLEAMAQMALAASGVPTGAIPSGPATKNISNAGAALNTARQLDASKPQTGPSNTSSGTGGTSTTSQSGSGPNSAGGSSAPTDTSASDGYGTGYTADAMGAALGMPNMPNVTLASAPGSSTPTSGSGFATPQWLSGNIGGVRIGYDADGSSMFFDSQLEVDADGGPHAYYPSSQPYNNPDGTPALNPDGTPALSGALPGALGMPPGLDACIPTVIAESSLTHAKQNPDGSWTALPDSIDPSLRYRQTALQAAPGYYVSQTGLRSIHKPTDYLEPSSFVNSEEINYIVLSTSSLLNSLPKRPRHGNLAAVYNRNRPDLPPQYAVYADDGEATKIGEGSIALATALGATAASGKTLATGGTIANGVTCVVFPNSGSGTSYVPQTQSEIDSAAAPLFDAWGGVPRIESIYGALMKA